jgi:hypothetical protein
VHPDDVRDYVAEGYAEFCTQLAEYPELGVKSTELDGTDIYVLLGVGHSAATAVDPALARELAGDRKLLIAVGPGQYQELVFGASVVPDLGQLVERELLLRVRCDDFDGQPPLAELLRPEDRTPLPDREWPKDGTNRGIVPNHPKYKRKFFCRPGFREFHEHLEHEDHPWDQIRAESTLAHRLLPLIHDLKFRWRLQ